MLWSRSFIPTLKEDPQEAEAVSHKLMVRAGLIRRLTSGAYTYLPMGLRALKKAEAIIREEMNRAGAAELLMPALQPVELWKKTGRYGEIGDVMIKFTDRHGREVALGPTHEEIITDIVAREIRSYKDLPFTLYQIQTKFRDEVRARFGVVRSCEFLMKDAYSFDVDASSMEKSYKKMYDAYCRIFERCGLNYVPVEADPGMMGGSVSHEFMVPCDIGEDRIAVCSSCGYAGSTEVAPAGKEAEAVSGEAPAPEMEEVDTPGASTVEEVSSFMDTVPADLIKTLIYLADGEPVALLVRGDHEINETKAKKALGVTQLELAGKKKVEEVTGGEMGFSGPVGLSVRMLADRSVRSLTSAVTGANKKDRHIRNVTPERDFQPDMWIDIRDITPDDNCPVCGSGIRIDQAVEIGHTFKLGQKYSGVLGAAFLDESGKERPVIMGCYGIGVNRILASLIENSHDDKGIIWPVAISPCEVVVIPVGKRTDELLEESGRVYEELKDRGVDVILDDRDKTTGVKFKDADLVGFPVQVVVGKKGIEQGKVEINCRRTGDKAMVARERLLEHVEKLLETGGTGRGA
ncbi:MAG: proline--tRNA ligase [Candidatus Omnitrophica bacterium]|nr:proline--tRNA ligase [Candidatus Omnitrophota bacterium]